MNKRMLALAIVFASLAVACGGGGSTATDAGQGDASAVDAAYADGSTTDGGGVEANYDWADWPLPPEHPVDYTCSAETCTDNVTGLLWQRQVPLEVYKWDAAKAYCRGLILGGFSSGWRLPAAVELTSIVDVTVRAPAINSTVFQSTPPSGMFWTSTPYVTIAGNAWQVGFDLGDVGNLDVNEFRKLRCVRSQRAGRTDGAVGAPAGQYTIDADTVKDNRTGLTWQRCPAGQSGTSCLVGTAWVRSSLDSETYCSALNLGGFSSGWRLPTYRELQSILDRRARDPAIDYAAFPSTPTAKPFYAASPRLGHMGYGWGVIFSTGYTGEASTGTDYYVRCVR